RDNHADFQHCLFACFLSHVKPRSVAQALEDLSWVNAMQEEMQQFKFQNEESIDYDEFFALVARIEAIRLFFAFASYMGFLVYQMDVKSAFLYESVKEEVYVTQPKGFVDPQHPKKVYKIVKALYGLHQAPRAWYATLSTFLLKHGYRRGTIDKTLFLKKNNRDIILVQVYVDDIIFGSTKKAWCDEFEALMKGEFQISAMGELTFFLGLQVQQRPGGIFIHQDKYVQEILNKFDLGNVRTATTPYEAPKPKSKSDSDSPINVHLYRSMIGSLMYLTASMPDIMFAVSACLRHQVTPTTSNLEAVKKNFKYLKGQPKLGLWYPKESPLVLEAYSDSDYAWGKQGQEIHNWWMPVSGTATTPYEALKPKSKSDSDSPVNVHLYRSMIGSLMYLTASMPDIMFAVSACSRHQVTLTTSNLEAVKKIFKYLKGQPKKSITGGCQFLGRRLISWAPELGPPAILATIDRTPYTITEDLVRSRLHLADDGGVADLPISKIYSEMDNLGYLTKGKLTFFKNKFSHRWRFLVHTLLHCLNPKSGSWDQFGSPIAIGLICLFDGRRFNRSNYILRGMFNNIGNAKKFLIKLFANMRLNFAGNPMTLLPAMLLQAQEGEGAKVDAQDVPHPVSAPNQSPAYLPTPPMPQSSNPVASVLEHDHSFHQHKTAVGSFLTREDAPLGGDFHTSPTRSSHAPPTGQPSGGAEDPITLTALSSVVSTLVQKVHSLEAKLHDHKKLFKDVVGKLVKKVKTLEVKLKTQKRKMVVCDSDQEDGTTQNLDLDALRALANAAVAVDLDIPSGSTSQIPSTSLCDPTVVPPGASGVPHAVPADSLKVLIAVPIDSPNVPAGVSSKGKYPMVEEDIHVKAKTFRQMEEDRLGEEAVKRLHDEEMAHMEKESVEAQRKRQQKVIESAMYYNESNWLNIRAQVEANAFISKTLLGDDVSEDNFPARMAALIKQKRQALAEQLFKERQNRPLSPAQQKAYMRQYVKNQSSAIYNTGWTMAYVISFSDEQLKQEFEEIRKVQSHSKIQAFSFTLKRPGSVLEEPSPKRPKSPEAPTPSMPEVPISPAVTSPPSSRTK
nr:putative ribonuclease H-like domain-containing protein [Tanacetum cinerariifolium]